MSGSVALTDALVQHYLRKRGFTSAAAQLPEPALTEEELERRFPEMQAAVQNRLLLFQAFPGNDYRAAYKLLKDWVHGSLDLYKAELLRVLYPVLVHCYLQLILSDRGDEARDLMLSERVQLADRHQGEVDELLTLTQPSDVASSEVAKAFLDNKYRVLMSTHSCTLLKAFLQAPPAALLLVLINERMEIKHVSGHPSAAGDDNVELAQLLGVAKREGRPSAEASKRKWGILDSTPLYKALISQAAAAAQQGGDKSGAVQPVLPEKADPLLLNGAMPSLAASLDGTIFTELKQRVRLGGGCLPSALMYTLSHASDRMCCASISRTGHLCVAGCADGQIRVWNNYKACSERMAGGQLSGTAGIVLTGHAGCVYDVALTPAEEYILSAGADGTARLWSTELREQICAYNAHTAPVWCIAPAPRGHYFATGSYDRTARIWSLDSGHPRRMCVGHASDVDAIAWHPSCNYIATGSSDRSVRLWDVSSGECVRLLPGHGATPRCVAFSPDGQVLATGCDDGAVCLWDLGTARRLAAVPGGQHGASVGVNCLAWSAEGTLLVSGSADGTCRIWDTHASRAAGTAAARKVLPDKGPGQAAPVQGPEVLQCAKVLPSRSAQIQSLRFTNRNLLFVVGTR